MYWIESDHFNYILQVGNDYKGRVLLLLFLLEYDSAKNFIFEVIFWGRIRKVLVFNYLWTIYLSSHSVGFAIPAQILSERNE